MDLIFPRGIWLRIVLPWSIPSKLRSSIYRAAPVSFSNPSLRKTFCPTAIILISNPWPYFQYVGLFLILGSLVIAHEAGLRDCHSDRFCEICRRINPYFAVPRDGSSGFTWVTVGICVKPITACPVRFDSKDSRSSRRVP